MGEWLYRRRCASQIVLQERQKLGLVVLARLQITQRVPFARVHLQLVRLVVLDQLVDQLRRMKEVNVLVDQAVDDQ